MALRHHTPRLSDSSSAEEVTVEDDVSTLWGEKPMPYKKKLRKDGKLLFLSFSPAASLY